MLHTCTTVSNSHAVNYVYHKMLLNENYTYIYCVLVAGQFLLVTIENVYRYKTRNREYFV